MWSDDVKIRFRSLIDGRRSDVRKTSCHGTVNNRIKITGRIVHDNTPDGEILFEKKIYPFFGGRGSG